MPVKRLRGFTLINLIFIVAIVSVTVALLYPVLEAAKEQDRSTKCLNNLKQCAVALCMYADDNDARMPSSGVVSTPPTQAQIIDFLTAKGDPYPISHGSGIRPKTWPQFLGSYFRDKSVVFCPLDRPRSRVSYWYKYANDRAWWDPAYGTQKIYGFFLPTTQIAFYEHAGFHTGDAAGIKNGVKINVAFIDTHVETITVTSGPINYPPAVDERTGAAAVRLGLPMYFSCHIDNYYPWQETIHSPGDYIDPSTCCDRF